MTYRSLLQSTANTRELGGIRTCDGRITNDRVFWRSDVPVRPTDSDIKKLRNEHITAIIDMRTVEETERTPNLLADTEEFEYYHFPITEGSGVPERLEAVPYSYMDIALAENMPEIIKVMAESRSGVLFHCTAGKDRTGVLSAIILMICGADRETIVSDYVLSREYNRTKLENFLSAHPEIDRNIVLANEKSMNGFISLFTERFATVEAYLEHIGADTGYADMIRKKLTD